MVSQIEAGCQKQREKEREKGGTAVLFVVLDEMKKEQTMYKLLTD